MAKTRDLFKKIGDSKGTFHAKMCTTKDRNGMDLEDNIKKRQQEYTEELYKKYLMTQVITMVWSLTQSQTSWNVKSNGPQKPMKKARGGNGIRAELFQILKDDAVKVLHSICQQIWKTRQWPQDWKRSVFIPIPKKGSAKECSNYALLYSFHMLAK